MSKSLLSHHCPSCQEAMRVQSLRCDTCDVEVRARFSENEFSLLGEEELHLLRVFLQAEGRIKEMEAPLGLSYPTLRQKISELSLRVQSLRHRLQPGVSAENKTTPLSAEKQILKQLGEGKLSFDEAHQQIKALRTKKK